jgi:hypothetical protein
MSVMHSTKGTFLQTCLQTCSFLAVEKAAKVRFVGPTRNVSIV